MAAPDVTLVKDSAGNVKLNPYVVTLVRWCVSCLWSTATVLLHRFVTTPLPQITALKSPTKLSPKPRAAGNEHLHPDPLVECQVLYQPQEHNLDIIFVHGLYGSLGNTWRQGDWSSKRKLEPNKVSLRTHDADSSCNCNYDNKAYDDNEYRFTKSTMNEINEKLKMILPNENSLITEKFYNNTLLDQVEIIENYDVQAKFVSDLFKKENRGCDKTYNCAKKRSVDDCKCKIKEGFKCNCNENECKCDINERRCEVGCGCICDDCYSPCWPRDWLKMDYPDARVISINYTSDPYLWRPLWIKGFKRLRLQERAEQMTTQLLDLGVGKKPIIWVGHSKGGLFIKQIYCDAYEAYLKVNNKLDNKDSYEKHSDINKCNEDSTPINIVNDGSNETNDKCKLNCGTVDSKNVERGLKNFLNSDMYNDSDKIAKDINIDNEKSGNETGETMYIENYEHEKEINKLQNKNGCTKLSSNIEEDGTYLRNKAGLWLNSAGFMFYSVPHRGSPLADIKTPITARSVELLEICKNNSLILSLQERWLQAASVSRPHVRSLVETCRTLMSVLYLRIVSVDSADAGIGALCGVSVDHREICKPSSRQCLLYKELMDVIRSALKKCRCPIK